MLFAFLVLLFPLFVFLFQLVLKHDVKIDSLFSDQYFTSIFHKNLHLCIHLAFSLYNTENLNNVRMVQNHRDDAFVLVEVLFEYLV